MTAKPTDTLEGELLSDLRSLVGPSDWIDESLRERDAGSHTRARLLLLFTIGTGVAGLPFCLLFWLGFDAPLPASIIAGGVLLIFSTRSVLRYTESLTVAANWASFCLFVTLAGIVPLTGGLTSPGLAWIVLVPVFALVFGGRVSGLAWAALTAACSIALFAVAGPESFFESQFTRGEQRLLTLLSTVMLMGLNMTLFFMYRRYSRELFDAAAIFENRASADPLTGLPNRREFERRLIERLHRARRERQPLAVGMIDLDDFKHINDNYGHAVGDNVLVKVAQRLAGAIRDRDVLARVGGDEFAVLVESAGEPEDVQEVGRRLATDCGEPLELDVGEFEPSCSIGFAVIDSDQLRLSSPETARDRLMESADAGMYEAKKHSQGWTVEQITPGSLSNSAG